MKLHKILWLLCISFILAACSTSTAATQTPTGQTPAASPTYTLAPLPSATNTPTPPPSKVILVAPQGSDPALAQSVAVLLGELAAAQGMSFEETSNLASAPEFTRVVVFINPGTEIKNLAGNTPNVQFVAIGALDLQPLEANLSQIIIQPEAPAFLAGYIAALVAPDWRTGGLLVDTPSTLQQAFLNGGRYHCGRCAPQYAPVVLFPVATALPKGSDPTAGWKAFKELDVNLLEVLYIDPALSDAELLAQFAGQDIGLIGGSTPSEDIRQKWIATVRTDSLSALKTLWPDLLAGKGAATLNAPLVVEDINPDWLSDARLRLVLEVVDGLKSGTIAPVVP